MRCKHKIWKRILKYHNLGSDFLFLIRETLSPSRTIGHLVSSTPQPPFLKIVSASKILEFEKESTCKPKYIKKQRQHLGAKIKSNANWNVCKTLPNANGGARKQASKQARPPFVAVSVCLHVCFFVNVVRVPGVWLHFLFILVYLYILFRFFKYFHKTVWIPWYGGSASSFQVQETPQSRYLLPSTQRTFTHSTVAKNHFTWTPKTALRKHMNPCAKSTVGNASGTLRERFFVEILQRKAISWLLS